MPLNIYYLVVRVEFSMPMPCFWSSEESEKQLVGFQQEFGCTAISTKAAKKKVLERIQNEFPEDKGLRVCFDWCGLRAEDRVPEDIYADSDIIDSPSFKDPRQKGFWYSTGRGFYYG